MEMSQMIRTAATDNFSNSEIKTNEYDFDCEVH